MQRGLRGSSPSGGAFAAGGVGEASGGSICPAAVAGLLWGSSAAAVALRARGERGPGDELTSEMSGTANMVSFCPKCQPESGR